MMAHLYTVVVSCGVVAPGHGREVVDGLKSNGKSFLLMLMTNLQLPSYKRHDTQM